MPLITCRQLVLQLKSETLISAKMDSFLAVLFNHSTRMELSFQQTHFAKLQIFNSTSSQSQDGETP